MAEKKKQSSGPVQPAPTQVLTARQMREQTKQAQIAAETAKAQAAVEAARVAAEAEAKRLEAAQRAEELKAQQERERAKRAADERANSPLERGWQVISNVAAAGVGVVVGHKVASSIEARHIKAVESAKGEVDSLARKANALLTKVDAKNITSIQAQRELQGVVNASNKLALIRRPPLGLAVAAALVGEGAMARFVLAPSLPNESAKEAARAVGTASIFAASTIIAERLLARASPVTRVPAAAAATIETARLAAKTLQPAASSLRNTRLGRLLGLSRDSSVGMVAGPAVASPTQNALRAIAKNVAAGGPARQVAKPSLKPMGGTNGDVRVRDYMQTRIGKDGKPIQVQVRSFKRRKAGQA